jgi:hypothetical protein
VHQEGAEQRSKGLIRKKIEGKMLQAKENRKVLGSYYIWHAKFSSNCI